MARFSSEEAYEFERFHREVKEHAGDQGDLVGQLSS